MRVMIGLALVAASAAAQFPAASPEAARAVVRHYYAAIDRGEYRTAYRLWNGGKDYPAFVQGFARTARTSAVVGTPGDEEGAAGSSYITVPVRVNATLKNGVVQHFAGNFVLRRVNDVDGATPAERRWRISAASLHPTR